MADEDVADYQDLENEEGYAEDDYGEEYGGDGAEDIDPEAVKEEVLEMADELAKLTKMQEQMENKISAAADSIDENSIYVGQVDYDSTTDELRAHFSPCGTINRITITIDPLTGRGKGYAYIEFADKDSVDNALKLDDSTFKGRQLKVLPKRKNVPVVMRGGYRGRGRGGGGFRGRGGRGGGRFAYGYAGRGYRGGGRGRGGFRGRGQYAPSYY